MPPARVAAAGAVFVQLTAAVSLLYAPDAARRLADRARAPVLSLGRGRRSAWDFPSAELLIRLAGWPAPPFANVAMTFYLYFLSQTILRHRLLD